MPRVSPSVAIVATVATAVAACAAVGALAIVSAQAPATPAAAGTLQVTYIANQGVLLAAGDTQVLIDGLHRPYQPIYPSLPEREREEIETARPPFDGIDLILVSHVHRDHFHPEAVARHLRHNPKAVLVSSEQVVREIQALGNVGRHQPPHDADHARAAAETDDRSGRGDRGHPGCWSRHRPARYRPEPRAPRHAGRHTRAAHRRCDDRGSGDPRGVRPRRSRDRRRVPARLVPDGRRGRRDRPAAHQAAPHRRDPHAGRRPAAGGGPGSASGSPTRWRLRRCSRGRCIEAAYSARSATMGSTPAARRAGTTLATSAATASTATAARKARGSLASS